MGRLRTAVHTLADLELPPEEVLAHLNDIVSDLGDDSFATCLYAVYDPVSGVCSMARAGHPPPLLVRPDGTVELPGHRARPAPGRRRTPVQHGRTAPARPRPAGAVHRRPGRVRHPRHRRGHRRVLPGPHHRPRPEPRGPGRPPPACGPDEDHHEDRSGSTASATPSLDAMLPAQQLTADDTAVLVARLHRTAPGNIAVWRLPDEPVAASLARDHVRGQLEAWDLGELVMTTELLASELVGNVVRHAQGPRPAAAAPRPVPHLRGLRRQRHDTPDPPGRRNGRGRTRAATGRRALPALGDALHRRRQVHLDGAAHTAPAILNTPSTEGS